MRVRQLRTWNVVAWNQNNYKFFNVQLHAVDIASANSRIQAEIPGSCVVTCDLVPSTLVVPKLCSKCLAALAVTGEDYCLVCSTGEAA